MEQPREIRPGQWRARATIEGTRRSVGIFSTKKEALVAIAAAERDALLGTFVSEHDRTTLNQFLPRYLAAKRADIRTGRMVEESIRTIERRLRIDVVPTFGKVPLRDINYNAIRVWLGKLPDRAASNESYIQLRALLGEAWRSGLIPNMPPSIRGASKHKKTVRPVATDAELWAILDRLPNAVYVAMLVQFGGSMRIGEVLGLDRRHVDLATGKITIEQQQVGGKIVHRTKGKRSRDTYIGGLFLESLRSYMDNNPGELDDPVFRGERLGRRLSASVVREVWARAREAVGAPDAVPHHLRHRSLSAYLRSTGDLAATAARAGHAQLSTTATYIHAEEPAPAALEAFTAELSRRA